MANRKVLINRHTSGSSAPEAVSMYLGEIAVAHETGKETLFTKNNAQKMVPFISCAQTISIVSGMIEGANVVYDVQKKAGESFINVEKSESEGSKVFTLSTSGVASDADLKALSAGTLSKFEDVADILSSLTETVETFSAATVSEFNSAFTAINTLSGNTEAAIDAAIKALDVTDAAVAGQYVSSVSETDGKIAVSRADVSKAPLNDYSKGSDATAVAATDTVNQAISKLENQVVAAKAAATTKVEKDAAASHLTLTSSTAADGSVTYTIGENDIASKTGLDAVSGVVDTFSAATVEKITSAFTYVDNKINALDAPQVAEAGKAITAISQTDGVISASAGDIAAANVTVADAGEKLTATTVEAALAELADKAAAITIENADGSINVTAAATGTDINVNIKSGEKVLAKSGNTGLYTDLDLVKITSGLPAEIKERYQLLATDDSQIGVNIDVPKDSHIVSIDYITTGEHAQNLEYVYIDASGVTKTTYVDMSELVLEAEFASGVTVTDHIAHGVVDPASEKDSNNDSFLTVGADGFKVDGIKDEIDAKIAALDVTDTAENGKYVSAVNETDGKVSMTRANVSDAVLNGYAKGEKPASTAIVATDDVKGAIAKLEHQIDDAKAAATTKVVEGTDAGNNMEIVSATGADNSVTYTVNLTDVASKVALDAEIAARKAVDGQTGQTYAANSSANYISGATSLNDADVRLDAALKAVSDKVDASKVTEGSSVENFVTLTLDTATTAGTTALTINDSALKTKIDEINSAITAETKARQDAIADLDSTGQTTGNGYFLTSVQIADGKVTAATQSDKVNSASTADEAVKVANALSVSGYSTSSASSLDSAFAFDGSNTKSLTFGTNGNAGLKSMSMTSAGVVDVEVIDCGEY